MREFRGEYGKIKKRNVLRYLRGMIERTLATAPHTNDVDNFTVRRVEKGTQKYQYIINNNWNEREVFRRKMQFADLLLAWRGQCVHV